MTYHICERHIKKYRLMTALKGLPEDVNTMNSFVGMFLNSDDPTYRVETIECINKIFAVSRKMFAKVNALFIIDDATQQYSSRESYRDIDNGNIDYHAAYRTAFEYAALKYMLRQKDSSAVDGATFSLLSRVGQIMDFELPDDDSITDFDEITQEMLAELDCTGGKADANMGEIVQRYDYLVYLLLPRLDHSISKDHRAIYEAMMAKDSAAFNAVLDAP